ncbi:unnamed protein product [Adineta steineri]|uniref:Phospholipase B1, membrane-associated n=1 Tax=Adineta steineri TaxID=433720 RepID=A0A815IJB5_9BILA|nr:unnamed protein product [Adineta steineri]CAF3560788.1 unnamed protein product [Adineta steineri]
MTFFSITFFLFILLLNKNLALNIENYTDYIEELSHNEKFLEEYTKWSLKLFSQPDYLYGNFHEQFPCSIENSSNKYGILTSVHMLRPSDIKCIGAMGDSFTTGLSAHAITPIDLLSEYRGISWSIGGDYTYSKFLSIPNILLEYTSKLKGFSTKLSIISSDNQTITNNRLNVAKSSDHSADLLYQAELLIDRIKNENLCDWNNDWKMITIFIGTNDLCNFCTDSKLTKYTPEQYMLNVREALDKLYQAPIPRTLVNLVLPFDIRNVKELYTGNYACQILYNKTCPCAAFPTIEQANILDDYIPKYQQVLLDLINTGRYDQRDDFTVVIQPFMAETKLPENDDNETDFSYFAPDCFHFSGKGHAQVALSLWNNMFEPVGNKQSSWYMMNESLKCPTKEHPYIYTSKNSMKILNEFKNTTKIQTTTPSISTINIRNTSTDNLTTSHHHHQNHKKSKMNLSWNRIKFIAVITGLFIIIVVLILGFNKRIRAGVFKQETGRYHIFHDINDDDEVEVFSRPNIKSNFFDDNQITTTHGTRVSLK